MGAHVFAYPKDETVIQKFIQMASGDDPGAVIMDFFAGSGTTAHATFLQNLADGRSRRFIMVQLPEILSPSVNDQEIAANYCDIIRKPRNIAELTKHRIRKSSERIKEQDASLGGDWGFRVFKLAPSNISAWDQNTSDIEATLLTHTQHLIEGRGEQDVLYELLLKLGLDLCVMIRTKEIAEKRVYAIGGGALIVCLADGLSRVVIEPLSAGIVAWWQELAPAVETHVVFKDSGFADDVAKTNMAAILNQHGLTKLRSL